MSDDSNFIVAVGLTITSLFFTIYLVYGRVNHRPLLIGDYKPGVPGYDEFLNLVSNTRNIINIVALTVILAVGTALIPVFAPYILSTVVESPMLLVTMFATFVLGLLVLPITLWNIHRS